MRKSGDVYEVQWPTVYRVIGKILAWWPREDRDWALRQMQSDIGTWFSDAELRAINHAMFMEADAVAYVETVEQENALLAEFELVELALFLSERFAVDATSRWQAEHYWDLLEAFCARKWCLDDRGQWQTAKIMANQFRANPPPLRPAPHRVTTMADMDEQMKKQKPG